MATLSHSRTLSLSHSLTLTLSHSHTLTLTHTLLLAADGDGRGLDDLCGGVHCGAARGQEGGHQGLLPPVFSYERGTPVATFLLLWSPPEPHPSVPARAPFHCLLSSEGEFHRVE